MIPCGKAIKPMRKPESMTVPGTAATAGMFAIGAVSLGWTSGRRHRFAEQVIGRDLCRTEYDIRYQVIDARRSLEVWQTHYSRVRPHSAGERSVRCCFAWRERWGRGKAGRCPALENSENFPLPRLDDADYFLAADHHFGILQALAGFNRQTLPGEEAGHG